MPAAQQAAMYHLSYLVQQHTTTIAPQLSIVSPSPCIETKLLAANAGTLTPTQGRRTFEGHEAVTATARMVELDAVVQVVFEYTCDTIGAED